MGGGLGSLVRRRQHIYVNRAPSDAFRLVVCRVAEVDSVPLDGAAGIAGDCVTVTIDIQSAAETDESRVNRDDTIPCMHPGGTSAAAATLVGRISCS